MIVSFSGAQGTGKSQVLDIVSKAITKACVIPSVSSRAWSNYIRCNNLAPDADWTKFAATHQNSSQLMTQHLAMQDLFECKALNSLYLFDRSSLDVEVYTLHKHRQSLVTEGTLALIRKENRKLLLPLIDLVFFFKRDPSYAIEERVGRSLSDQKEVDLLFQETIDNINYERTLYGEPSLDVRTVPYGTLEEKANFCVAAILNKLV